MLATVQGRTETYEDCKQLISTIVRKHINRVGGDFDEALSTANVTYAWTYETHTPAKGNFMARLAQNIHIDLIDKYRKQFGRYGQRKGIFVGGEAVETLATPPRSKFNLVDFIDSLSEDAATVVRLTLEPSAAIAKEAEERGGTNSCLRAAVRSHLITIGWAAGRIRDTFKEIAKVLSE